MEEDAQINKDIKNAESNKIKDILKKVFFIAWDFFKIIVIAAAIVLPIRYFLFQPFIVKGDSMVPNFHSGDYLIIDEISYRFGNPKRGDVVVLKYPLDTNQRFIKRVIGLPGETVEIKSSSIKITGANGGSFILNEKKYLPNSLKTEGDTIITLQDGQYFVLGDNRQFSYDSRRWMNSLGQPEPILPRKDIIGKAFFRVFPISAMSYIAEPSY